MPKHNANKTGKAPTALTRLRIDKWLWAARFYKTRSLASEAIKGGKIHHQGDRAKPSKELVVGDELTIKQGYTEKTVIVLALSDKRGPAPQAALLYRETPESIQKRENFKTVVKTQPAYRDTGSGRPTKRERRKIIQFTRS
ncbi:MAG: S4 domain-containing protein [Gammaproteobacteria bacterium]|nr:S4 domain-containing protein [Gammaproteobacteria bacterium]MDH5801553.1 S4 domain-containing protein [Gammaproteobacteria bacterium]